MKYWRGFLMAWGNFSALPCPYHKWHEEARKAMLCMLPMVGLMQAVVLLAVWQLLNYAQTPTVLTGTILTIVYFLSTGFIHLDGFMDCSDAIMSRRLSQAERQRILKDSAVGAFAVVCSILMFFMFTASMATLAEGYVFWKGCFFIGVTVASRSVAADAVLWKPAMVTSQYASLERKRGGRMGEITALWSITLIPLLLVFFLMAGIGLRENTETVEYLYSYMGAVMVTAAAAHITGYRDRKNLGGMNGDIAGHMITMSEVFGVLTAAILTSWG